MSCVAVRPNRSQRKVLVRDFPAGRPGVTDAASSDGLLMVLGHRREAPIMRRMRIRVNDSCLALGVLAPLITADSP